MYDAINGYGTHFVVRKTRTLRVQPARLRYGNLRTAAQGWAGQRHLQPRPPQLAPLLRAGVPEGSSGAQQGPLLFQVCAARTLPQQL